MVTVNYFALAGCVLAAMALGFLWYGPIFGKQWMRLNGISEEDAARFRLDPASKRRMNISYAVTAVGSLAMAYVLLNVLVFTSAYMQINGPVAALVAALGSWLGFIAPVTLTGVLWDKKPFMLWVLNSGYFLVLLLVMGAILFFWR